VVGEDRPSPQRGAFAQLITSLRRVEDKTNKTHEITVILAEFHSKLTHFYNWHWLLIELHN
jgi:hypothetical protein